MTRDEGGVSPRQILNKNDVYTRWRKLVNDEHLTEPAAVRRVAEEFGLPAERVEDGVFAGRLTESEIRYRAAAIKHECERAERNSMVHKAIERGWSHSDIALATALTRSRVGQIALSERR